MKIKSYNQCFWLNIKVSTNFIRAKILHLEVQVKLKSTDLLYILTVKRFAVKLIFMQNQIIYIARLKYKILLCWCFAFINPSKINSSY